MPSTLIRHPRASGGPAWIPASARMTILLSASLLLCATALRAASLPDNEYVLNPTGGSIRIEGMDAWGGGEYLARRKDTGSRGLSIHHGVDYVGEPGQGVVAPIEGVLKRTGQGINTGAEIAGRIRGARCRIKLLHFAVDVPNGPVNQGQVIGRVKDIGRTYKGMTPHVHMEVHEWREQIGYRPKDPSIVLKQSETVNAE